MAYRYATSVKFVITLPHGRESAPPILGLAKVPGRPNVLVGDPGQPERFWGVRLVRADSMSLPSPRLLPLILPLLTAALLGCATSSRGLPFNTATHRLLDTTKQLRASFPEPQPLPRELAKGVLPGYYVEPGDTLLVQPANLDSPVHLPVDQVVLPDGQIELGAYGRLMVVNKTPEEIESDVQTLIDQQTPNAGKITVRLVGRQSKVYYVLGEVNSPGAYPLVGRETVLDAIIAAGGLTDAADRGAITFTRPTMPEDCRVVLPICYSEIVQIGDTSTNYQVGPGDRIYVPSMTLCKQLKQLCHGSQRPECPPCGMFQWPCPAVLPMHLPVPPIPFGLFGEPPPEAIPIPSPGGLQGDAPGGR
jgi:polysaccharide export outer membrane protein